MERFLKLPKVIDLTGQSRSKIYESIQGKEFPSPIKLGNGRSVAWLESEIKSWMEAKIKASRSEEVEQ